MLSERPITSESSAKPVLGGLSGTVVPKKGSAESERIRPELNIEKWPMLWRPSRSTKAAAVRTGEREFTQKDGTHIRARVEVGFSHLGVLTTEDQKTYYALVKQWELSGRSAQQTFFSIRRLARVLRKKWGTNVITAITGSLRRLRATPITWENAYFDGRRRTTLEEVNTLTILSELKIVRRKVDGRVTKEAGYFRFNDFTLGNLLIDHTKPVLFETILKFRSDLAQLLYTHLDLIMSDKHRYERRTRELFIDLGLQGTEYDRIYERKRALMMALRELQGVSLTTGVIASIAVERTQDKKDYKLSVLKEAQRTKQHKVHESAHVGWSVPQRATVELNTDEAALALVSRFHKLFHQAVPKYPSSKELTQAASLVALYGFDRAQSIVSFAHDAARATNYAPQTFGGILQYTARAIAAFDESRRRENAKRQEHAEAKDRSTYEALQGEIEKKHRVEAEARLTALPPDEFAALRAEVCADLRLRSLWLPQDESAAVFQRIVHRKMLAEFMRRNDKPDGPTPYLS